MRAGRSSLLSSCGKMIAVSNNNKGNNSRVFVSSPLRQPCSSLQMHQTHRHASRLASLKESNAAQIAVLLEEVESKKFESYLHSHAQQDHHHKEADNNTTDTTTSSNSLVAAGLTRDQVKLVATSAMAAMCVHHQSRIASLLGEGFYTIGPGGEELIAAAALALRPTDAMALHYRHVSMQMLRQLSNGVSLDEMLLNRARGHCVSSLDPVSGGNHCAIGGGKYDFVVTSTLASQAPPAVGRAIGIGLAHSLLGSSSSSPSSSSKKNSNSNFDSYEPVFPKDAVSFVTVGDGSVNNAHFLAAANVSEYWSHRHVRCPVVFGISDNQLCISLRGHEWLTRFTSKMLMPVFRATTTDPADQYAATKKAVDYARSKGKPACVVWGGIVRRFGHAATDRQAKYMSKEEIAERASTNPLVPFCDNVVSGGLMTYKELLDIYTKVNNSTQQAFEAAVDEPKIKSREEVLANTSAPMVAFTPPPPVQTKTATAAAKEETPQVMRVGMTRVYAELLATYKNAVYVGEDVEHGGYYLVTEGLKEAMPGRVYDWPPDETTLVGAGMGFAQSGLVPIVEIPYAKYLDCGADMFFEAAVGYWLSKGQATTGMIIRLQGFDRGIFGGNFHTHNTLHIPAGVDVVCYSNGSDYVRGIRYCYQQARAGRIVMSVDSTNLLNLRHVTGQDNKWLRKYPVSPADHLPWSEVGVDGDGKIGVVTYGNGVIAALQARELLKKTNPELAENVSIIDMPLLSDTPEGLLPALAKLEGVVFADVCKEREMPLLATVSDLQNRRLLPSRWSAVGASRTYNPLGSTITFLSAEDIAEACRRV